MRTLSSLVMISFGLFALVASAGLAHAQIAEQLFREGKRLMAEGKIAEACTAFEGSYRKDEAVTTLLNLADCREKNGQYASAWGHFIEAERKTRGNSAEAVFNSTAKDRAGKLEGRLSYLIINVPDEARVDGLEITRNGQPVDKAEWNRDIPVDGGTWKVEGKAPAFEAWSTSVTVGKEKGQAVGERAALPRAAGRRRQAARRPRDGGGPGALVVHRQAQGGARRGRGRPRRPRRRHRLLLPGVGRLRRRQGGADPPTASASPTTPTASTSWRRSAGAWARRRWARRRSCGSPAARRAERASTRPA